MAHEPCESKFIIGITKNLLKLKLSNLENFRALKYSNLTNTF